MKNKLHILGLRYYSWAGRMAKMFASGAAQDGTWIGQQLFLQRDHQCAADVHAVMAWSLTEPVGHVSKADLPLIAGVLEQGGYDLVVVRIVALDARRRALVVEPVDELPELPCREPEPAPWSWQGPVLPLPLVWAQADHFGRMMKLMLKGVIPYDGEVVRRYMHSTVTDLSADAYKSRSRMAGALLQSADPRLADAGHELLAVMDHMGSREQMTAWYNPMMAQLTDTPEARSMASRYADLDVRQVFAALRSFPFDIGREWLAGNTDLFVRRMYYAQIPRADILKLFSLIVLYNSACPRLQSAAPAQPALGLSVTGPCQISAEQLTNNGTVMSFEQVHVLPNPPYTRNQ